MGNEILLQTMMRKKEEDMAVLFHCWVWEEK